MLKLMLTHSIYSLRFGWYILQFHITGWQHTTHTWQNFLSCLALSADWAFRGLIELNNRVIAAAKSKRRESIQNRDDAKEGDTKAGEGSKISHVLLRISCIIWAPSLSISDAQVKWTKRQIAKWGAFGPASGKFVVCITERNVLSLLLSFRSKDS